MSVTLFLMRGQLFFWFLTRLWMSSERENLANSGAVGGKCPRPHLSSPQPPLGGGPEWGGVFRRRIHLSNVGEKRYFIEKSLISVIW